MSTFWEIARVALPTLGMVVWCVAWCAERRRRRRAELDATECRLRADAAEQDAAHERFERLRAVSYLENAIGLHERSAMVAEGWLLVAEAREQLDRVAWFLMSKLPPFRVGPDGSRDDLRRGCQLFGWDLSAWLRRADALRDALDGTPRPLAGFRDVCESAPDPAHATIVLPLDQDGNPMDEAARYWARTLRNLDRAIGATLRRGADPATAPPGGGV